MSASALVIHSGSATDFSLNPLPTLTNLSLIEGARVVGQQASQFSGHAAVSCISSTPVPPSCRTAMRKWFLRR
jgi:hypothetical protein